VKLDWSIDGWRVFPDDARFHGQKPERVLKGNVRVPVPVLLCLGEGSESNKGWVYVPDGTPLEVLS
jgi:hypothetical protein